jgi:hypothetical protein
MLARIKGPDIEIGLPASGILADGRTVSNYELLPEDVLNSEGWMSCHEVFPQYDPSTQKPIVDTVIKENDILIVNYKIVDRVD